MKGFLHSFTDRQGEKGQTVIEFGLIAIIMFMLSVGLVDVGRGFFAYNALASGARFGARWGSVMGGTCALPYAVSSSADFCGSSGAGPTRFWSTAGNTPIQGVNTACPSYTTTPGDYYKIVTYQNTKTIVGALASKYDSSSSSTGFLSGYVTPGVDLNSVYACIATSSTTTVPSVGATISVTVYYPFKPISVLLTNQTLGMTATSQFTVE